MLVMALCFTLAACGGPVTQEGEEQKTDTLTVGYGTFSGQFSPFYASDGEDADVCAVTGVKLLESDRGGSIVLKGASGEPVAYKGQEYTYEGIADCEMVKNADGTVTYNFTLRQGVTFSDGEALTADDAIFSMYVLCDPTYDGPSTFGTLPILGLSEYRAGMYPLADLIKQAGEYNNDFSFWTKAQQDKYWDTLKGEAGVAFAEEIVEYCSSGGYANNVAEAIEAWGYADLVEEGKEYTAADFFALLCKKYNNDYSAFAEKDSAGTSLYEFTKQILCKSAPEYGNGVTVSDSAENISGIVKTGEYSFSVTMSGYDASAVYTMAIVVAPLHYYGDKALFDVQANTFGFTKGDLTAIKDKSASPVGAGPYRFVSYEGGTVTFEANTSYYKGAPKIERVLFKESADDETLVASVADGTLDICVPSLSATVVDKIKEANGNGALTGSVITYSPVDFNGYGYIGINAANVKVANDAGSRQSKNLRKAFATLFSVYREEHIEAYYGELAEVIQYPISATSWAAPTEGDAGYAECFAYGVDSKPIYTDDMTREERYAAASDAAKAYLKAAGYTYDASSGRFTSAPYGARLSYTMIIPGGGMGDHPVSGIAEKVAQALSEMGITLNIEDPIDTDTLWNAQNAGTAELWAAAWTGTLDPDLYRVYYSGNYPTNQTGTGQNKFYLQDSTLDAKILEARAADNVTYRKSIYMSCLKTILDWSVEIPVYQRQQAYIFSTERLNTDTLPDSMTPYHTWLAGIEDLEVK